MAIEAEEETPATAEEESGEPPSVAEDVTPNEHSGDGNHRENT